MQGAKVHVYQGAEVYRQHGESDKAGIVSFHQPDGWNFIVQASGYLPYEGFVRRASMSAPGTAIPIHMRREKPVTMAIDSLPNAKSKLELPAVISLRALERTPSKSDYNFEHAGQQTLRFVRAHDGATIQPIEFLEPGTYTMTARIGDAVSLPQTFTHSASSSLKLVLKSAGRLELSANFPKSSFKEPKARFDAELYFVESEQVQHLVRRLPHETLGEGATLTIDELPPGNYRMRLTPNPVPLHSVGNGTSSDVLHTICHAIAEGDYEFSVSSNRAIKRTIDLRLLYFDSCDLSGVLGANPLKVMAVFDGGARLEPVLTIPTSHGEYLWLGYSQRPETIQFSGEGITTPVVATLKGARGSSRHLTADVHTPWNAWTLTLAPGSPKLSEDTVVYRRNLSTSERAGEMKIAAPTLSIREAALSPDAWTIRLKGKAWKHAAPLEVGTTGITAQYQLEDALTFEGSLGRALDPTHEELQLQYFTENERGLLDYVRIPEADIQIDPSGAYWITLSKSLWPKPEHKSYRVALFHRAAGSVEQRAFMRAASGRVQGSASHLLVPELEGDTSALIPVRIQIKNLPQLLRADASLTFESWRYTKRSTLPTMTYRLNALDECRIYLPAMRRYTATLNPVGWFADGLSTVNWFLTLNVHDAPVLYKHTLPELKECALAGRFADAPARIVMPHPLAGRIRSQSGLYVLYGPKDEHRECWLLPSDPGQRTKGVHLRQYLALQDARVEQIVSTGSARLRASFAKDANIPVAPESVPIYIGTSGLQTNAKANAFAPHWIRTFTDESGVLQLSLNPMTTYLLMTELPDGCSDVVSFSTNRNSGKVDIPHTSTNSVLVSRIVKGDKTPDDAFAATLRLSSRDVPRNFEEEVYWHKDRGFKDSLSLPAGVYQVEVELTSPSIFAKVRDSSVMAPAFRVVSVGGVGGTSTNGAVSRVEPWRSSSDDYVMDVKVEMVGVLILEMNNPAVDARLLEYHFKSAGGEEVELTPDYFLGDYAAVFENMASSSFEVRVKGSKFWHYGQEARVTAGKATVVEIDFRGD